MENSPSPAEFRISLMHRCPMIIVFEPLVHPGPHSVRSCFSHVQALGFRDGRFQLSLSFRRCSAQHVLVDGPADLRIVSGSVPAFPSAIFSFSDVALSIGPFLCHGIRLLCNDKCHGKIARAYGHSYQMVRKELPATALSLCIAYQSLMGMRSIFISPPFCPVWTSAAAYRLPAGPWWSYPP